MVFVVGRGITVVIAVLLAVVLVTVIGEVAVVVS